MRLALEVSAEEVRLPPGAEMAGLADITAGHTNGANLIRHLAEPEGMKGLVGVTLALGTEHQAIGMVGGGGAFGALVLEPAPEPPGALS